MLILLNTSVVTRLLIFLTLQVLFVNYHFYIFLKVYIWLLQKLLTSLKTRCIILQFMEGWSLKACIAYRFIAVSETVEYLPTNKSKLCKSVSRCHWVELLHGFVATHSAGSKNHITLKNILCVYHSNTRSTVCTFPYWAFCYEKEGLRVSSGIPVLRPSLYHSVGIF